MGVNKMTMFEVKNYKGQLYLKKELRETLNTSPLRCISFGYAAVLFPNDVTLDVVRESLEIILDDIKLRMKSLGVESK